MTFLVVALTPAPGEAGSDDSTPAERVPHRIERLDPDVVGTDRAGHLWAWSRQAGTVVLFDDEGRERKTWQLPEALAVDADAEWGVVALDPLGTHLIQAGAKRSSPPLELYGQATGVSWLDGDRVAVGSALGSHRVQVWDLPQGEVVRRLDEEGAVPPGVGARLSRTTEVALHPDSGRLYVLDSFSGELEIFDSGGKRLRKVDIRDEERQGFMDWLQGADAEARRTGDVQRPAVWRFHLDLDPGGDAWIVEGCDTDAARMLRVPPTGDPERLEIQTSCCSRRFAIWNGHLVFHRRARPGQEACNDLRRLRK